MVDDDRDFTFGKVDKDFSGDDNWGELGDDSGNPDDNEDFVLGKGEKRAPSVKNPPAGPAVVKKSSVSLDEEPTPDRRNSSLMMISGALVMVLSAAGFYYFTTSPSPPAAVQRPAADMPGETVPAATATSRPVPKEVPPAEPVPAAANPEISIPHPPAAPVEFKINEKPATPAEKPAVVKPATTKSAGDGAYVVQAGAFADSGNRDEALAKLRKLGYEGKTAPVTLVKPMTRLLVGVYPEAVAKRKLQELSKMAATAFSLRQGKQLAIYAGSFQSADMARELAAKLARKGIKTKTEQTKVKMTLWRLTLPGFADREAAETAARRIRTVGLDAKVIQNPR